MRRRPSVGSLARKVSRVFPSLELSRTAHFVLKRRALAARILPLAACAFTFASVASAGATKTASSGKAAQAAPLSLVSEYSYNNPNSPPWCLNEDDVHQRVWSGSIGGTFTASEQLCSANVDYFNGIWWDAGGIGLQAEAYVVGTLSDLTITSPLGDAHHAVLVGSSTSKGVTSNRYEVCYVPPFSLTSRTGGTPVPGGTWALTISGTVAKASYYVDAQMAYVTFQMENCPPSEQNLTP